MLHTHSLIITFALATRRTFCLQFAMALCFHLSHTVCAYSFSKMLLFYFSVKGSGFFFFWHCCCAGASTKKKKRNKKNVLFPTTKGLKTGYDSCSEVLRHVRLRESDNLQGKMQRWQSSVPCPIFLPVCHLKLRRTHAYTGC